MELRALRENAGLSQSYVAKKCNVTVAAVSNWENRVNGIARKYHKKLAKLYGVTVADIEGAVRCTAEGREEK